MWTSFLTAQAVQPRPLAPSRSKSYERHTKYSLFPTVEPTPPASPALLKSISLSKAGAPRKARSASLDETPRIAAEQQNAVVKTVAAKRGRKVSAAEIRHMSTVQEMPSPTVSIPYSYLPRCSEDTGHARSSSAPGEFVRDSQTLPSARIDLSKPQWVSKQADTHPAKGLVLSMPASVSVDRLDKRRDAPNAPNAKPKPNLTIEIKNDPRMKPNAIVVREEDIDYDAPPPPPPPKSPRHDSRNQSLSNITFEPVPKVRRTRSRTASGNISRRSNSSPDPAHPSGRATIASQGSFVKAALVDTPSPSSPAPSKPVIPHARSESFSPLSGDVKIKELMAMTNTEAQDDLERPIPPPITPGQPRVASLARVVSIPSLPKSISVEGPVEKAAAEKAAGVKVAPEASEEKHTLSHPESKSTETIVPIKRAEEGSSKQEHPAKEKDTDSLKVKLVTQGAQPSVAPKASPAVSSMSSKAVSTRPSRPNLDKPMPSLPPPSSRFSEHMRQVRAAEGTPDQDAPPVPSIPDVNTVPDPAHTAASTADVNPTKPQPEAELVESEKSKAANAEEARKEEAGAAARTETQIDTAPKAPENAVRSRGLSAFPSVPPPPRYYGRGPREESPSTRGPPQQRLPPRDIRQPPPSNGPAAGRRFPPGHPLNRPVLPRLFSGNRDAPREIGPPRSRFYGRQSESANNSQTSLVERPSSATGEEDKPKSPEDNAGKQPPVNSMRSPNVAGQTPKEQQSTPLIEAKASADHPKLQRPQNASRAIQTTADARSTLLTASEQPQDDDHLKRPASPANLGRSPSPSPSIRPSSPGDLLSKFSSAKSLPSLPPEPGPRPTTPDVASVLTFDARVTISDPVQTLQDLTRQSEALHARHASLRADRLKLSTAISASLKDSKPGPEYANLLLDQHLSLNAINSSLDICFAKLKSLDCKKEEAIQKLVEQAKDRQIRSRRHKGTPSVATHTTQASLSGHSSKASTPDIGTGVLPAPREKEVRQSPSLSSIDTTSSAAELAQHSDVSGTNSNTKESPPNDSESERASLVDGLPTPKPKLPGQALSMLSENTITPRQDSPMDTRDPGLEKRNTMVKLPSVSPAPSLFTKELVEMSPVSPIEEDDTERNLDEPPRRITIKGAKAAKILGLVAERSESPSNITLPDASPTETRNSPVEMKIQRKPVPGPPKGAAPPPPGRVAPVPPQPGRKRTNDSASTVQTDSSPESEVRTPRASQEGLVPKGLKIGKKQRPPQAVQVQVVNDDDILDYYAR